MPKVIDLPTVTNMDSDDFFVMEESTGGTKKITNKNVLLSRAYQGTLTASDYLSTLVALPVATKGVYDMEATATAFFSKNDSSATGLIVFRKTTATTLDYICASAGSGRPFYVGRVSNLTSTPTVTVSKLVGTNL